MSSAVGHVRVSKRLLTIFPLASCRTCCNFQGVSRYHESWFTTRSKLFSYEDWQHCTEFFVVAYFSVENRILGSIMVRLTVLKMRVRHESTSTMIWKNKLKSSISKINTQIESFRSNYKSITASIHGSSHWRFHFNLAINWSRDLQIKPNPTSSTRQPASPTWFVKLWLYNQVVKRLSLFITFATRQVCLSNPTQKQKLFLLKIKTNKTPQKPTG